MNYKRLTLSMLCLLLGALILLVFVDRADASPVKRINYCTYTGVTNAYYHSGEQIVLDPYTPNTFGTYLCDRGGMRIYKARANTYHEVLDLKAFASENDHAKYRMAYCRVSRDKAYVVDLAYFYYAEMKIIKRVEKDRYVGWLDAYAEKNGCRVY